MLAAGFALHELCQGVVSTAARLQHAAYAFARTARWSPQATSYTWGRDALACAITSHSGEVIIRGLAQRVSALGLEPLIQAHLDNAARALNPVCTAWRAIADEWDLLSTGTNYGNGVSRVANEIGDLVLRIGRLAYANPGWTPASGDNLPRSPAAFAPAAADLRVVLTAVHHANGTLACIAGTDRWCVRQSRRGQQALHPHPPPSHRPRHPPPLRTSSALARHPSAGWLPPGRQDGTVISTV